MSPPAGADPWPAARFAPSGTASDQRALVGRVFEHTVRGELSEAGELARAHVEAVPAMRLELGHIHLVRGMLLGEWDGHSQAAALYLEAAEELSLNGSMWMESRPATSRAPSRSTIAPSTPLKTRPRDPSASQTEARPPTGWELWAKAISSEFAGQRITKKKKGAQEAWDSALSHGKMFNAITLGDLESFVADSSAAAKAKGRQISTSTLPLLDDIAIETISNPDVSHEQRGRAGTQISWMDVEGNPSRISIPLGSSGALATPPSGVDREGRWVPLVKMKPFEHDPMQRKLALHRRYVEAKTQKYMREEEEEVVRRMDEAEVLQQEDDDIDRAKSNWAAWQNWYCSFADTNDTTTAPRSEASEEPPSEGSCGLPATASSSASWANMSVSKEMRRRLGEQNPGTDEMPGSADFASLGLRLDSIITTAPEDRGGDDAGMGVDFMWEDVVAAEALLMAGLLKLNALDYEAAGTHLKTAWRFYHRFRGDVSGERLAPALRDDLKIGIGVFTAVVAELPDGLKKTLGTIASLGSVADEVMWLHQVSAEGGPRALHAAILLAVLQVRRPSVDAMDPDFERGGSVEHTIHALVVMHPDSVLLHLLCSLQRRRARDPQGALDAVGAATSAWDRHVVIYKRNRRRGKLRGSKSASFGSDEPVDDAGPKDDGHDGGFVDTTPPAITMVAADANLAALNYEVAAKLYKEVIGYSVQTGRDTTYQARAGIRLAGAMTLMGLQRWPGVPWGYADEWILHCVAAPMCPREEEEVAAAVAARFAHYTQYRPLLPFWLLFSMGDLETLGPAQQKEVVRLLDRLGGQQNPCRPPKQDFMAFPEGKALWRLLMGAAVAATDAAYAKRLWTENLNDRRLENDSIAIAYSQLLLGETEVRAAHRRALGVRMLVKGAQLAGDRSTALRVRYTMALQSLPWESLDGLLPEAWWELWVRALAGEGEAASTAGESRMGSKKGSLAPSTASVEPNRWLGHLMSQREEIRKVYETTKESLGAKRPSLALPSAAELRAADLTPADMDRLRLASSYRLSRHSSQSPSIKPLRSHTSGGSSRTSVEIRLVDVEETSSNASGTTTPTDSRASTRGSVVELNVGGNLCLGPKASSLKKQPSGRAGFPRRGVSLLLPDGSKEMLGSFTA